MPGRMEFDLSLSRPDAPRIRSSGDRGAMRLLVIGDFSGQPAKARPPLAERPTLRVDVDSLDAVMGRLGPRLHLAAGEVGFGSLDDFHPDALLDRLDVFRALREMRQRLADPARFAQAAAELGQVVAAPPSGQAAAAPASAPAGLLAQWLGGNPVAPQAAPAPSAATGIDALIRQIVAPHIVPDIATQQASLLQSVDVAITDQMRALLHAPAFQQLEAAWRGVQWLISSLELDEQLQLHLFDVSRDELLDDVVAAQGRIAETGTYRALVDRWRHQPGGQGWSLISALFGFGPSVEHIGLLAALGVLAAQAGAPLLAAGDPALAGDDAQALAGWASLRHSEVAPWIGLAAPQVLLRLPYGPGRDPVQSFRFDEMGPLPAHQQLLWGNGGLACTLLIARAFSARGWGFEPGDEREIGDLPALSFVRDGEPELQACAEHHLGEAAGNALMVAGLMPVMSHRHRNAVTVMRFQSVAAASQPLAGLPGGQAPR